MKQSNSLPLQESKEEESKQSDLVPILPKGVFCILKSTGVQYIASRDRREIDIILIGGMREILDSKGQLKEKVSAVWPVTPAFFNEMYTVVVP